LQFNQTEFKRLNEEITSTLEGLDGDIARLTDLGIKAFMELQKKHAAVVLQSYMASSQALGATSQPEAPSSRAAAAAEAQAPTQVYRPPVESASAAPPVVKAPPAPWPPASAPANLWGEPSAPAVTPVAMKPANPPPPSKPVVAEANLLDF